MARYRIENKTSVGSYGNGQGVEFRADTFAHAQTTAQQFSTLFQVSVMLIDVQTVNGLVNGTIGFYPFTPGASGSALGSQSTGISW